MCTFRRSPGLVLNMGISTIIAAFPAEGKGRMAMAGPLGQFVHEMQESGSAAVIMSPHLDDAVLSCGALPARLQLRAIGVTDADDFYEQRRAEDAKVVAEIGAVVVHLGLRDAMFRRIGDTAGRHLFPG